MKEIQKKKIEENINIITNNRYYKLYTQKYTKMSNKLIQKITNSKFYEIANKIYPWIFISNSMFTLPIIYYFCFKKR